MSQRQEVLLLAAITRANIMCAAMTAENDQRRALGNSMAYTENDFAGLIESEQLGYNQVIEVLDDLK